MTKGEIMQRLPDITKYKIDQARLLSKSGSGLVIEEKVRRPRERMDQEKMQHALNFFFDPSFVQIVSYGTRELSFDTGEKSDNSRRCENILSFTNCANVHFLL